MTGSRWAKSSGGVPSGPISRGAMLAERTGGGDHTLPISGPKHVERCAAAEPRIRSDHEGQLHPRVVPTQCFQYRLESGKRTRTDELPRRIPMAAAADVDREQRSGAAPAVHALPREVKMA